jgi:ABC-type branched-subunit amino acid transport system substrate-binding protein
VDEVRIGFIGPLGDRDGPILPPGFRSGVQDNTKTLFGRRMLRGATLAIEEGNQGGGYQGKPFRLVLRTDLVQWGQTSDEMVKFTYRDKVWAVLSGIDSNHNHVLLRATLKTEVPIVNAGSTDPTLTETGIPWIVRCINDDRQNAYLLLDYIYRIKGFARVAVLRVNDRDGRLGILEFLQGARRLKHPVLMELRFLNGDTDFRDQLVRIQALSVEAVVLWGNPREAGVIVKQMRGLGMHQPVFGFDRMSHPLFLEAAGPAGEGVVAVSSYNPTLVEPRWQSFRRSYRERFDEEPDAFSAHAYDGAKILIWAIRRAGLNRARLRDALFSLETFPGVTGAIVFDTTMNNVSVPWLVRVEDGHFRYFRPPGWTTPAWLAAGERKGSPVSRLDAASTP